MLDDQFTTPTEWPVYWFAKLEKAVSDGDHQLAAEAQQELQRLGVKVNYGLPQNSNSKGVARG